MLEEEEETAPRGGDDNGQGQQADQHHQPTQKQSSREGDRERSGHYSSSSSRTTSSRYEDDYSHRSNRDRDRDRDRERSHRDRDYHRDRNRDREYGGRYRDHYRDHRDDQYRRDRRSSRSRSRSKESRSRDRDRERDRERNRSHRDDRSSRDGPISRPERTAQDRLSAEIEQELANLRRQHDMKEALKRQQQQQQQQSAGASSNGDDSQDDSKPSGRVVGERRPTTSSSTGAGTHSGHYEKQHSSSFMPQIDPGQPVEYVPEIQTEEERIEFQRKMQEKLQQHLAAEGKLYPPPSKPQRDVPAPVTVTGFANDGSFLEMFKKLQQQQSAVPGSSGGATPAMTAMPHPHHHLSTGIPAANPTPVKPMMVVPTAAALPRMPLVGQQPAAVGTFKLLPTVAAAAAVVPPQIVKPSTIEKEPPPPPLPVFGRRRGGKILKTGMVKKVRPIEESAADAPNDAWTLYLQEVKKYKSASCDADSKTRPLVK
ncbi:AGAP006471-PA [Anopheles gambiae str. PEST]|uniref:AGAP006471-PA n=1 Tax=Anopheles gambiae TaxID=7165 RepID=Q7Q5F2_ANOGA|nr:AGAP006471-PA [Anopheles gambiae str. PEST]